MPKRKISYKQKKERRTKEVLKAQVRGVSKDGYLNSEDKTEKEPRKSVTKERYKLPMKNIRTDLIKTGIFLLFVIGVLYILKSNTLQFYFGINK